MSTPTPVQATCSDLRRKLIEADAVQNIATLKRELAQASALRARCATAAMSLAGTRGSAEDLQDATENERALQHRLQRARAAIGAAADAAVPEMRQLAEQLAADAAALAGLLRDLGAHVAEHSLRPDPARGVWPTADASARGLAVLAGQLKG